MNPTQIPSDCGNYPASNIKHFIVGICSMFENDLKLFCITAADKYEAVKKGMLEHSDNNVDELAWQASPNYPVDYEGLCAAYEEMPFDIIEVGSFI